jgi:apolipoprotein N-acyltransferase
MAKTWRANLCALLLGGMLTLAFAPFEVFPFAVLSLAGLLGLWLNTDRWRAFRLGWLFGVGLFSTGVYWIYISVHDVGDVPVVFSLIITGALIAVMALYPAFVGYCLSRFFPSTTNLKLRYAFPALWTLGEYLRGSLFSGFPWLLVGYSQTYSPLKGWAPLFSVFGVSLLVAFTSGLLVNVILKLHRKQFYAAYINAFLIFLVWMAGAMFNLQVYTQAEGVPIKVSLVQGNIPQRMKWSPEHVHESLATYANMTESLWGKGKLIIWPEAAVPLPLQSAQGYIEALDTKAKQTGTDLFIGIPIQTPEGNGYYNAIATLGNSHQVYLKRQLVPFGEYVPVPGVFAKFFDFLHVPLASMMSGSTGHKPLMLGDVKILPAICYEIAYPELMRSSDSKIGLLLTVTNDAWFGESIAQAQHLQMAAMRAIEYQRPLLFVSNDGITAIISANGIIQQAAPTHQAYVLQGQVQPKTGMTPWMATGLNPLILFIIMMLFFARRSEHAARKMAQQSIIITEKGLPQS